MVYPYIVRLGSEYDINSSDSYLMIAKLARAFKDKEDARIAEMKRSL
jgi:hypothetical protein